MNKPPRRPDTNKLKTMGFQEKAKDSYSAGEITKFHIAEGEGGRNTLFVPVGPILDTPEEAKRPSKLDQQILLAAHKAGWSEKRIGEVRSAMGNSTIAPGRENADYILDHVGDASSTPYATQVPIGAGNKASSAIGIVLVPEDADLKWKVDRTLFADYTGIENPERPFPSADKVHAFMLAHEVRHIGDPEAFKLQATLKPGSAAALGVEETGDVKAMPGFLEAYHDRETLRAFAHARAMAGVRGLADHMTAFDIDAALEPKAKGGQGLVHAPEKIIDGEAKLTAFLTDKLPSGVGFESGPSSQDIYRALVKGMASGEIKDPNAVAVAQRYVEAFDYFAPKAGARIRAEAIPAAKPRAIAPGAGP